MKNNSNILSTPRELETKPLQITEYKIISVEVAQELDQYFRRFAIATVVIRDKAGDWDDSTIHQIELKHCYNKSSKGPNKIPYLNLLGLTFKIMQITPAEYGDLDIVTWTQTFSF